MRFRQHQSDAQAASRRLLLWFGLLVAALVVAVNLALAGIYRLLLPLLPLPAFFWATNTGVVLMLVVGGAWLETQRLRTGGGERVARWAGGRLLTDPRDLAERRLLNVVDEMALASGQPRPAVYLLEREPGINAFVAGWTAETAALAVTRGALERLTRDELQGLVAHELGHIREGDLPLNMRLLALVWGLSLVHGLGVELTQPDEHGRHPPLAPFGLVLRALGWLGWLAGRLLQAAVSRQREYLADACALQFTRSRDGLGNTLRKIWFLQRGPEGRLRSPHAEALAAMLLDDGARRRWLATHPPLAARIERVTGRGATPLPAPPLDAQTLGEEPWPARPLAATPEGVLAAAAGAITPAGPPPGVARTSALASQIAPQLPARPAPLAQALDPYAGGPAAHPTIDPAQARARLALLHGPLERRCGVLAALLTPGDAAQGARWMRMADALPHAGRILADMGALPPADRLGARDALLTRMAAAPAGERRALIVAARRLLGGPGHPRALDVLRYAACRLHPSLQPCAHPRPPRRAAPPRSPSVSELARVAPGGSAWAQLVHAAWKGDARPVVLDAAARHALRRGLRELRLLPWMQRPAVLKAWCGGQPAQATGWRTEVVDAATRLLDLPPLD